MNQDLKVTQGYAYLVYQNDAIALVVVTNHKPVAAYVMQCMRDKHFKSRMGLSWRAAAQSKRDWYTRRHKWKLHTAIEAVIEIEG
jgi:hypothetical protein